MKRVWLASSDESVNTFLQLVHDQERGRAGGECTPQLRGRIRAGRHHQGGRFRRPAEGRGEPGTDEGGLSASRRPDQSHEPPFEEPLEDGRHDLLPSEEQVAVL